MGPSCCLSLSVMVITRWRHYLPENKGLALHADTGLLLLNWPMAISTNMMGMPMKSSMRRQGSRKAPAHVHYRGDTRSSSRDTLRHHIYTLSLPPPFWYTLYGNRHTLPRPTALPAITVIIRKQLIKRYSSWYCYYFHLFFNNTWCASFSFTQTGEKKFYFTTPAALPTNSVSHVAHLAVSKTPCLQTSACAEIKFITPRFVRSWLRMTQRGDFSPHLSRLKPSTC